MSRFPYRWWELAVMALASGVASAVLATLWQEQPLEREWVPAVTAAVGCALGVVIYGWIGRGP